MKNIEILNRVTVKILVDSLKKAAKALGDEMGVDFIVGNCSFGNSEAKVQMSMRVKGAETPEEINLKTYTDFKAGDRVLIPSHGIVVELVGYKPSRPKYPLLYKNAAGKLYKASDSFLKNAKIQA